jgi:hypothetical protein
MSNNWTLEEAKGKLFGDEPELTDLGIARRQITFDVSIAEGSDEDGVGLSVILGSQHFLPPLFPLSKRGAIHAKDGNEGFQGRC